MLTELIQTFGFGLVTASVVALAGVAITLQFGVTNYINFASGTYMILGAYITWELNTRLELGFWYAVGVSALLMGVFAVATNAAVLQPFARRNPPLIILLIVTLGVWMVMTNTIVAVWGPDPRQFVVGGDDALTVGPFLFTTNQLLIMGVACVILALVHLLLTKTKLGKAMRAVSDDASLAQASGIDTELIVTATWFLTGVLIGVAGSAFALNLSSFQPWASETFLFVIFSAVILGGIGRPYGAMIGALIIGLVTEMSATVLPTALKSDVAFLVLIIMLLVRPQGLMPARVARSAV